MGCWLETLRLGWLLLKYIMVSSFVMWGGGGGAVGCGALG